MGDRILLKVPHRRQESPYDCGPAALHMVLSYHGRDLPYKKVKELLGFKEGKAIWSIQLALAAKKLGFEAELWTTSPGISEAVKDLEYYRRFSNLGEIPKLFREARRLGVKIVEKRTTMEELEGLIRKGIPPIVLVDWNRIVGREGYQGHFIVLTGFDDQYVYYHNPAGQPHERIRKEAFHAARTAPGTDEDVVVVWRG